MEPTSGNAGASLSYKAPLISLMRPNNFNDTGIEKQEYFLAAGRRSAQPARLDFRPLQYQKMNYYAYAPIWLL